jgi:hypothetical protein
VSNEKGNPTSSKIMRLNGEIIAKRIIEVACDGERDPDEACARASRAFGFQQPPNC